MYSHGSCTALLVHDFLGLQPRLSAATTASSRDYLHISLLCHRILVQNTISSRRGIAGQYGTRLYHTTMRRYVRSYCTPLLGHNRLCSFSPRVSAHIILVPATRGRHIRAHIRHCQPPAASRYTRALYARDPVPGVSWGR